MWHHWESAGGPWGKLVIGTRRWRAGGSYAGIAAELNAEHVPTKRGRRWHASVLTRVGMSPRSHTLPARLTW